MITGNDLHNERRIEVSPGQYVLVDNNDNTILRVLLSNKPKTNSVT